MSKTYKIIENPPYDEGAPNSYWIEETSTTFFGLIKKSKIIGNYYISGEFGYLGDMPFFSKDEAEKRIKQLKNNL